MEEKNMNELLDYTHAALNENYEKTYSIKIGGTTYEVTTHFNKDGKESVFQQFKRLILGNFPNLPLE